MVNRRPRLRTRQSHLTALKYPPQIRSPTISTDSSPLQSWAHTFSRETQLVSREIKRKSLTSAVTFTTDQVTKGISSCSNTQAFGPDKFIIFHIKHLGSRGIEYLTALFNDSVTSCRIWSIWKSSIVIPIPKPGKNSSLSNSYRPISLLCPAAKVMETLLLPTVIKPLLPSADQQGSRPGHSTTSALLQLTSNIVTGFNQRKPPHRTDCVAVDLTVIRYSQPQRTVIKGCKFNTDGGDLSMSNYLRGRQSAAEVSSQRQV